MTRKPTYKGLEQRNRKLENLATNRRSLRHQLNIFQLAFDQSSEGIAVSDLEGNLQYLNNAFVEMHGYSPEELIGKHLSILHSPEQLASVDSANLQIKKKGFFKGNIWHTKRDGSVFPTAMHNSLIRDKAGNPIGMMATLRDITDIKEAKNSLQKSERMYRMLFEGFANPIILLDSETKVLMINSVGAKNIGLPPRECIGKSIFKLVPALDDSYRRLLRQVIVTRKGVIEEKAVKTPTGTRWFWSVIEPVFNADGRSDGVQIVSHDFTKRKKAEQALERVHKDLEQRVRERTKKLREQANRLEEVNTALNVLLKKREEDKLNLEEKVLFNVKEIIEPLIDNLKNSDLNENQISYADTLKTLLSDIVSPFSQILHTKFLKLTLSEIRVANLIKEGKTTKEIAILLNSTPRAVVFHRQNIRKKLGLSDRKANLGSHLLSLLR